MKHLFGRSGISYVVDDSFACLLLHIAPDWYIYKLYLHCLVWLYCYEHVWVPNLTIGDSPHVFYQLAAPFPFKSYFAKILSMILKLYVIYLVLNYQAKWTSLRAWTWLLKPMCVGCVIVVLCHVLRLLSLLRLLKDSIKSIKLTQGPNKCLRKTQEF